MNGFGSDVTNVSVVHDDLPIAFPDVLRQSSASDNLYEHEDPWHTIGVILGLSPTSQGKSHTLVRDTVKPRSALHTPKSW